jgi:hypothetical protein
MYGKDGIETFGTITNLTKDEIRCYANLVKKIEPNNPLWKNDVMVVLKKSETVVEMWRTIFKTNKLMKERKYCCSYCKRQGHNKLNIMHK